MGTGGTADAGDSQLPDPLSGWVDADLASRLAGQERFDVDLTAADLAVAEWAGVSLPDRWLSWIGSSVTVGLPDGTCCSGVVHDVLTDGVVITAQAGQTLIPIASVAWCRGGSSRPRAHPSRLPRSAMSVLRDWSGCRREVLVVADGVTLRGLVVRVGADHLDVSEESLQATTTVAWSAVLRVQAQP